MKENQDQDIVNEEIASDSLIFVNTQKGDDPELVLPNSQISDDVDPITEAIRREILDKQRNLILNAMLAKEQDEQEKQALQNCINNPQAFAKYCEEEEKKKKISDFIQNQPDLKKQLENVEIRGYQGIHEQFKDRFSPINWDGERQENIKTQIIKNGDSEIAKLTETTHKVDPSSNPQGIKEYRTINFPRQLEDKDGKIIDDTLHLSMALKDVNGRNMPKNGAVFFTAHYEHGKLVEVSSPSPVKFTSDKPDAVGYIEHGGKIYSLPVTRAKYQEMMQEVAKNHGHGVNISSEITQDVIKIGKELEQQSENIEDFLKKLDGKSLEEQTNSLSERIAQDSKDIKQVVEFLEKSPDGAEITTKLLTDSKVGEKLIKELSKTKEGIELVCNAYLEADKETRGEIKNLVVEQGSSQHLARYFLEVDSKQSDKQQVKVNESPVEQKSEQKDNNIVDNLNSGTLTNEEKQQSVVKPKSSEVIEIESGSASNSSVFGQSAPHDNSPINQKNELSVKPVITQVSESQSPKDDVKTKVDQIRGNLVNQIDRNKEKTNISEMVKDLSKELLGLGNNKSEQEKKLSEALEKLSSVEKKSFLEKLDVAVRPNREHPESASQEIKELNLQALISRKMTEPVSNKPAMNKSQQGGMSK